MLHVLQVCKKSVTCVKNKVTYVKKRSVIYICAKKKCYMCEKKCYMCEKKSYMCAKSVTCVKKVLHV